MSVVKVSHTRKIQLIFTLEQIQLRFLKRWVKIKIWLNFDPMGTVNNKSALVHTMGRHQTVNRLLSHPMITYAYKRKAVLMCLTSFTLTETRQIRSYTAWYWNCILMKWDLTKMAAICYNLNGVFNVDIFIIFFFLYLIFASGAYIQCALDPIKIVICVDDMNDAVHQKPTIFETVTLLL